MAYGFNILVTVDACSLRSVKLTVSKRNQEGTIADKDHSIPRMVQTRRSSALDDVDTHDESDWPEPPSKKVKVSGTPKSCFMAVTANLLSILCKIHPPIYRVH